MRLFRHPEDRGPVLWIFLLLCVDLAIYLLVDHVLVLAAWSLLSLIPKAGVCAYNHHHQHVPTFLQPVLNRALELMYFLHTGVAGNAWVLHHSLGHHLNYLDQTKDESRWARDDGSRMGEWEYAFVTTATAYTRAWAVGARYPKQRQVFAMMIVLSAALVAGLVWARPVPGLFIFVLTPALALFGTALATYTHHSERSTADHFVASNNILQPFYNKLTGNLGFHTAHHYKPGVHWSKLPQLHAEIEPNIPRVAYTEPGWPWKLMGVGGVGSGRPDEAAVAAPRLADVDGLAPAEPSRAHG